MSGAESPIPVLRIVRGAPTPEEIAVVAAVLSAAGGGGGSGSTPRANEWASPARAVRMPLSAGPRAWSRSIWPQ